MEYIDKIIDSIVNSYNMSLVCYECLSKIPWASCGDSDCREYLRQRLKNDKS